MIVTMLLYVRPSGLLCHQRRPKVDPLATGPRAQSAEDQPREQVDGVRVPMHGEREPEQTHSGGGEPSNEYGGRAELSHGATCRRAARGHHQGQREEREPRLQRRVALHRLQEKGEQVELGPDAGHVEGGRRHSDTQRGCATQDGLDPDVA